MTFDLRDSWTPSVSSFRTTHRENKDIDVDEPRHEQEAPFRLLQSRGVSQPSQQLEMRLRDFRLAHSADESAVTLHVWIGSVPIRTARQQSPESLRRELDRLFEAESLEDGITHAAEEVLARAIRHDPATLAMLAALCADDRYPHRPAVLRSLGRLDASSVGRVGIAIMQKALRSPDIELRDAAIVSLERWATPEAVDLLRTHEEREPWLAEYVERLIRELG